MSFKSPFLLLFFFSFLIASSQEIQKGSVNKDRQFLIDQKEISATDSLGNFVSIRPHRINGTLRNYFIEFHDALNFTKRVEIETQNETKILDVFIVNEKAHVFIKERENKSISLRCDLIDLKTQSFEQKLLLKVNKKSTLEIFRALKNDFEINLEHSSQIVLSFPVIKDKLLYAYVKVFTKDLEELKEHKIYADKNIPSTNTRFLNTSQDHNNIYLLFNVIYSKDKKTYKLIELNSKKSLEIQIEPDTYELINSDIRESHYVISGLYSKQKDNRFLGFTNYTIDLGTFTLKSQQRTVFSNERARQYFKGIFKADRSIDIKNIFIDEQLNTYVIGQFYIMKKQQVNVGIPIATLSIGTLSVFVTINPTISYKVYDDILIGKINPNGELLWDNVLELRQTEEINNKYKKRDSSTFTFFANNHPNILMNGYINTKKDRLIIKQDKRLSKTNLYNVKVTADGKILPEVLFQNSDFIFIADRAVKTKNNIHILGQGNMRKQLLKLTF
ncbi:hypothetical protein N9E56_01250 [Flavobacteriaceae bacterium]|nr:hypothetical protein [Flavobacteriaceae bacterium]